jgi:hypothetical protein
MNCRLPATARSHFGAIKQGHKQIALCTILLVTFFPLPSFSQNTLAPSSAEKKPPISINDEFRGKIHLAVLSNTAEISVLIVKKVQSDANTPEYEIEALAVVKINDRCSLYGLTGQYDDNWRQLNLYGITDAESLGAEYNLMPACTIPNLDPFGFIGKFSDNPMLMQCQIAYGDIEALYRIEESKIASRGMRTMIKECQAGITSGDLVSKR